MRIDRVQVEEGFLDGLDVGFKPGLNALIGARGTGKTSLIELIRYCLDIEPFSERPRKVSSQQALSVLRGGQVTTTFSHDGQRFSVTRSARDEQPRPVLTLSRIAIFGPNEIESVGVEPAGRLRLLDLFRSPSEVKADQLTAAEATVRSLTKQVRSIREEAEHIEDQLNGLASVPDELEEAQRQESRLLRSVAASDADQDEVRSLQGGAAQLSVRKGVLDRSVDDLSQWRSRLEAIVSDIPIFESWPDAAGGDDLLGPARKQLSEAAQKMSGIVAIIAQIEGLLQTTKSQTELSQVEIEDKAREIRKRLEELERGAGAITRVVANLKEQAGQLAALSKLHSEKSSRRASISDRRWEAYRSIEAYRDARFDERKRIANRLNRELGPFIRIDVSKSELDLDYVSTIESGLRGSGLHYNTLAPRLATCLSPRELAAAVESQDASSIAESAEIPHDRAAKVTDQLRDVVEGLLTSDIDDGVTLNFLHGTEYKTELSTGQRCTVVLSVLLALRDQILLVDQPEDNLDNAFVADTLVRALRTRGPEDQYIFVTHNPNIPVLGDADQVILLESDGHRGFVSHSGPLDDPESVRAITSVMEGGMEAFRTRAEFYGKLLD